MTYAAELAARYSETRRRLYGEPTRPKRAAPVVIEIETDEGPKKPTGLPFTWRAIVAEIEAETGISLEQMRSQNRKRPIAEARWRCWYRMRTEIAGSSWSWIAQLFHRDRTTVIHGAHKYCIENNLTFPAGEQNGGKSKPRDAHR